MLPTLFRSGTAYASTSGSLNPTEGHKLAQSEDLLQMLLHCGRKSGLAVGEALPNGQVVDVARDVVAHEGNVAAETVEQRRPLQTARTSTL